MSKFVMVLMMGLLLPKLLKADSADLVSLPSGPAAWTIDIAYPQTSGQAPVPTEKRAKEINVTQDGRKIRTVITWSTDRTTERWSLGGMILSEAENGKILMMQNNPLTSRVLSTPFILPDALAWLTPELKQGDAPSEYEGKQCFHYKGTVIPPVLPLEKPRPPVQVEAWIDSKTLLPVAVYDGTAWGTFTFSQDPPASLELPEKFEDTVKLYELASGPLKF